MLNKVATNSFLFSHQSQETMFSEHKRVLKTLITAGAHGDGAFANAPEPEASKPVLAGSMAINFLALALPITILQVYDRVLPNAAFTTLNALILGLCAVIVIDLALKHARSFVLSWAGAAYAHKTSTDAMKTILKSSPSAINEMPVAGHLDRISSINSVGDYLSGQSRIVKIDMFFIPLFAAVIFIVGGPLLLVPIALFGVFGYLAFRRTETLRAAVEDRETTDARKNDFIIETLKSMPTVKSLATEPSILRRFERLQLHSSDVVRRTIVLTSTAQTYAAVFASLSTISIVAAGAVLVIHGQLTIGGLACCMLLSSQLLQPLTKILSAWNEIQLAEHHREKVNQIFDDAPPQLEQTNDGAAPIIKSPARVSIRKLSLDDGESKQHFENLNLDIPAGAMVAFRGDDSSGRTSLLRAITGEKEPKKGAVCIGDVVATPQTMPAVRNAVRYVSQKPVIFRGTILENLSLFGKTQTDACLWASTLIGLDKEIVRMPLGYDTRLENTSSLDIPASTAQRICIARAIAMRPAVLIFDESNTSLDLQGEKEFITALQKLNGKMTVLLATHRPSICRLADLVYDVEDGGVRILEEPLAPQQGAAS